MQTDIIDQLARTPLSKILLFAIVLSVYRVLTFKKIVGTPAHKRTGLFGFIYGVGEILDAIIYAAIFIFFVIRPFVLQTFRIPSGSMVPTLMIGDAIVLNKAVYRYSEPKRGDIVVFRPPLEGCFENQGQIVEENGVKRVTVDFVKRLVGEPGDLVEIKDNQTFINGKALEEEYKQLTRQTSSEPSPSQYALLTAAEKAAWPKANWKLVMYEGKLIPLGYTAADANARNPRGEFGVGSPYLIADAYAINDPTQWDAVRRLPAQKIPKGMFLFMGDNRNGSFDGRAWGLVPRVSIIGRAEVIAFPFSRMSRTK